MKKILLALSVIVLSLCSCTNNITNNPDVDEPTNETKTETPNTNNSLSDEKSNCLVNISVDGYNYSLRSIDCIQLNSLTIKDKNGKVVGTGKYWGSYYVPYDGTLTINWKHRDDYSNFNGELTATWANSEYTFNVASAHTLDVVVYNDYDGECYIIIGGSTVVAFEHEY